MNYKGAGQSVLPYTGSNLDFAPKGGGGGHNFLRGIKGAA